MEACITALIKWRWCLPLIRMNFYRISIYQMQIPGTSRDKSGFIMIVGFFWLNKRSMQLFWNWLKKVIKPPFSNTKRISGIVKFRMPKWKPFTRSQRQLLMLYKRQSKVAILLIFHPHFFLTPHNLSSSMFIFLNWIQNSLSSRPWEINGLICLSGLLHHSTRIHFHISTRWIKSVLRPGQKSMLSVWITLLL